MNPNNFVYIYMELTLRQEYFLFPGDMVCCKWWL